MEWGRGENKGGVQSALKAAWEAATPEVIPTIARPYVENWSNYDFFRGRAIEDAGITASAGATSGETLDDSHGQGDQQICTPSPLARPGWSIHSHLGRWPGGELLSPRGGRDLAQGRGYWRTSPATYQGEDTERLGRAQLLHAEPHRGYEPRA